MPRQNVLRAILVALATVTLLAAPAAAAAPDRGGDDARSGWTTIDFGDLLSRVSGLLLRDWVGERPDGPERGAEVDREVGRVSGAEETTGSWDPNG